MKGSDYAYISCWARKIRAINLLGGKCSICDEPNVFSLVFHHIGKKDFKVSDIRNRSWTIWKNEIKECVVLCSNCHKEKHFKRNKIKDNLLKLKNVTKCNRCNYGGSSLEFHHIEENKKFNFGEITGKKIYPTTEQILEELEKVIVICANCHKIEHVDKEKFLKFEKRIRKSVNVFKLRPPAVNRQKVKKMYEQGYKLKDIAENLNCAVSTVCDIVHKKLKFEMKLKRK